MSKFTNFFEELWFRMQGGNGRFGLGNAFLIGMSIILPIFLIMMTPFFFSLGYPNVLWLQDMAWIFPTVIGVILFISALSYMIYLSTQDGPQNNNKKKLKL